MRLGGSMVPSGGVVLTENARWELKRLVLHRRSAEPIILIMHMCAKSCIICKVSNIQERLCCYCMRHEAVAELSNARPWAALSRPYCHRHPHTHTHGLHSS